MAELVIKLVNGELAGRTMQEINKEISTSAQALKKAEIGTQAWVDAHAKLTKAKDLQADLKKQIDSTTSASDMLKKAWNNLPGAQFFNQVADSIGMMRSGVGGLVTQFGVLKTAIAATGIGLLVLVLGSLYTWFTKTEEGADKLKSVMYPLQVLFQKLTGIVANLGGNIFKKFSEALSNPMQAIKDLGAAIYDNIIKRFESLGKFGPALVKIFSGDIVAGFKDLGNATIQLTSGIENGIDKIQAVGKEVGEIWDDAYEKGQRLLEQENAIEDAEVDLVKSRARLNVELSRQMEIARDVTKTDKERYEAARNAIIVQDKLSAAEEHFLRLKLQHLKLEQDLDGILTDDEKLERARLEAELIQLQADNIDKKRKAAALMHGLELEQMKEKEEADKKAAEQKVADDKKAEESRKKAIADKLAANELDLITEQNALNEKHLHQEISQEQFAARSGENILRHKAQELEILKAAHGQQSAEYQKAYGEFLKIQQAGAEASVETTKKLTEDQRAALQGGLQVFGNVFGSLAGMYEQGTTNWKAMATAQAIISTIQGAINAYSSTAAIPLIGPALAPIAAGLALAAGYAQVRKIQNTKVQSPVKKELGGYLYGPRHTDGGIPIEAEGGEFIFSRKAVRAIGVDRLSRVNNFYTRRFAAGGPVNPFQDRPPVSRSNSSDALPSLDEKPAWVDELIAAQDRRIDRIRVINIVTETEEGIRTVNQIREAADV